MSGVAGGALTEVGEAEDVDEGVHVGLGCEVDSRAHVAQRRVDVLRVRGAQPVQRFPILLHLIVIHRRLLSAQHACAHTTPLEYLH
jgi:hypothetical protein